MGLRFDRTVSQELLTEVRPGGRFDGLIRRRNELLGLADVQLRKAQGLECHASLYIGLTSVLNVRERRGLFALSTHKTHRAAGGFDAAWSAFQPASQLAAEWSSVEAYLDRLLDANIDPRWYRREGAVHALMCSGRPFEYGVVQREAAPWADGPPLVRDIVESVSDEIWAATQAANRTERWWPGIRDRGVRKRMGDELDVLAVDRHGRLLCMEAKPAEETAGIVWSAAQVLVYTELFARWLAQDPGTGSSTIANMAEQRIALGLLDGQWLSGAASPTRVVPVVAIGPGRRSPVSLTRLADLSKSLEAVERHPLVDPIEVWLLDADGDPEEVWRPWAEPPPTGRGTAVPATALLGTIPDAPASMPSPAIPSVAPVSEFTSLARRAASDWKVTSDLPPEAKVPAAYEGRTGPLPFVLPVTSRWLNLLPEAREIAGSRFAAADITWHGDGEGPNPHLLSSQIQCLNALAPLVDRPADLARWLGTFLPAAEVIPFGARTESPYDASDHVVFEWRGLVDHLHEWGRDAPSRGTRSTSIDAAIRYVTPNGAVEMALIEWKYTESYPYGGRLAGSAPYHQRRLDRYRAFAEDREGPVRLDQGVEYEDLFAEPIYQLLRQQLMAWRIEATGELDVARAVVVHASPAGNTALRNDSLAGHRFRAFAEVRGGLVEGWRALLRRTDRFVSVDTASLLEADVCTEGFRKRYAHLHVVSPAPAVTPAAKGPPSSMSGEALASLAYDEDVSNVWVGRTGGMHGAALADDVATGSWRARSYKVARGTAAPNAQWFRLDDMLALVAAARQASRAAAGWEVVGTAIVESAGVAFALPEASLPLPPGTDLRDDHPGIAGIVTLEDNDFPVEVRRAEGATVEARIDLATDVEEQVGTWRSIGTLDVGGEGVLAVDPSLSGQEYGVRVPIPGGRWRAEVYNSKGDDVALRLVPDR